MQKKVMALESYACLLRVQWFAPGFRVGLGFNSLKYIYIYVYIFHPLPADHLCSTVSKRSSRPFLFDAFAESIIL